MQFYQDGSAAYWGPSGYAVPFIHLPGTSNYISPTVQDETLVLIYLLLRVALAEHPTSKRVKWCRFCSAR